MRFGWDNKTSGGALSHMLLPSAGHDWWVKTRRARDVLAELISLNDTPAVRHLGAAEKMGHYCLY